MPVPGKVSVRASIYKGVISKQWFCHITNGNVLHDDVYRCESWKEAMEVACRELRLRREIENGDFRSLNW